MTALVQRLTSTRSRHHTESVRSGLPEPIERGQRYMPGLDGLRALAVLAVLAYHLDIGWAQGGLLGVGVFFTLSGYLITDLLLEQTSRGGIRLGQFWLRRARRLLPALFVMLVVVTAWVTLVEPSQLDSLRGAVAAAAGYVSNWWLIFQDIPYVDLFAAPSPLGHLWSLSIEEQFYLVWPFVLLLGLRYLKEPGGSLRIRPRLALLTLGMAAVSIALMALLYAPGLDSIRVYDGTDTRAFGLLIGAALAMVWPAGRLSAAVTASARRVLDGAGIAGLVVIALLVWRTSYDSAFLYPTGLVLLSFATAVVVAALAHPATRLGRALGWRPLRWIGVRSYGIYLWHFPVIALTTPFPDTGFDLPRATLQTAATFALAALSWRYVEEPVRHGALGRLWRRARSPAVRLRGPAAARLGDRHGRDGRRRAGRVRACRRVASRPGRRPFGLDLGRGGRGRAGVCGVAAAAVRRPRCGDRLGRRRRPRANLLPAGRPHRRLDVGGPHLA